MTTEHNYLLEILPKLNQINILIDTTIKIWQVKLNHGKFDFIYTDTLDVDHCISTGVGESIDSENEVQVVVTALGNYSEIRVLTKQTKPQDADVHIIEDYLSDQIINPLNELNDIYCKYCGNNLVETNCIKKSMSLPSPYWIELADLWICTCSHNHKHEQHDDKEQDNGIPKYHQVPLDEITSRINCCLNGIYYILLHTGNLLNNNTLLPYNKNNIITDLKVTQHNNLIIHYTPLYCSHCNNGLGYFQFPTVVDTINNNNNNNNNNITDDIEKVTTVKLLKHCISTIKMNNNNKDEITDKEKPNKKNLFEKYNIETSIAYQIESVCQARNCFRFKIIDSVTLNVQFLIILINWNTFVTSNMLNNSNDLINNNNENNVKKGIPIIKIAYMQPNNDRYEM